MQIDQRFDLAAAASVSITRKTREVPEAIVRTAAHRPIPFRTYRKVTANFNRRYRHIGVSIGNDGVGDIIKEQPAVVAVLHRQRRARPPRHTPVDDTWAMDITGFGDENNGPRHLRPCTTVNGTSGIRITPCDLSRCPLDDKIINGSHEDVASRQRTGQKKAALRQLFGK